MKTKKIFTLLLAVLMTFIYATPISTFAIFAKNDKKTEQQDVIDYINLPWWQEFEDSHLEGYILMAIENNHDLKKANLRVEQAAASTKLQFANELPSLAVGASPMLGKLPGSTSSDGFFSLPIIAQYELDIFLKNRDKSKSVKKIYEASKISEKASYITIISTVGTVYYNIVKLDKLISLQEEIINNRAEIYELMKLRNEEGITSTSDLVRANKSYVLAVSDISDLKKARDLMLTNLAVLIGDSPNNINDYKRISYDEIKDKKQIPASISSEIIVQRPDYLYAEKMIEKAKIDVRVAKKEFLPSIDILGLLGFTTSSMPAMKSMSWTNSLGLLGANAMLPLFTGGAKIANLKLQKINYNQIMEDYQKTNLVAIKEVNDSLCQLKFDDEKLQNNLKALNMEAQDFKYAELRYNSGVISKLDLIQQQEVLLSIEKLVVSSNIDKQVDQIGLYKATAGGIY